MEKNVIWAVVLSALFLMVWHHFFQPVEMPSLRKEAPATSAPSTEKTGGSNRENIPAFKNGESVNVRKPVQELETEKSMETAAAKIVMSSRGGAVKHWWLKETALENHVSVTTSGWVNLVNHPEDEGGQKFLPLEILPFSTFSDLNFLEVSASREAALLKQQGSGTSDRAFSEGMPPPSNFKKEASLKARSHSAKQYSSEASGARPLGLATDSFSLGKEDKNDQALWRATLPSGVEVEKRYILENGDAQSGKKGNHALGNESHFMKLLLSFRNHTKKPAEIEKFQMGWRGGLGTIKSERKENLSVSRILAYPSPTKEVVVFKSGEHRAEYAWLGMDNRYYLLALFPKSGQFDLILTDKPKEKGGGVMLTSKSFMLQSGETKTFELKIYAGPKGYTRLKTLGLGLEHAVDFGTFGFLGKWALKGMDSLHKWIGNYGWAIVILTCLLQLIVFPLSLKSYKSMAGMKKLQPKIQELQRRYKSEPQRLNQEMLNLYKEAKTNPFGGCLPMILQIPIFWAFFTMLRNSYELRGTPWILWIKDLSQHDPYYILPIVMGGGMFLQQKISGAPGDPTQAKIMGFMPIIFTFMFLKFPSGLVLYWLVNSILSMTTQYWFSKKYA